jgi:hypothetical protein
MGSLFEDWLAQSHPTPAPTARPAPAGGPFQSLEEAEETLEAIPEEAFGELDDDDLFFDEAAGDEDEDE